MTSQLLLAAGAEAAEDALVAGPEAIMAGAADAEAGGAVLADLLAHELAAGHKLMLRLAAAANAVLDWSSDGEATAAAEAELAAGRLAAAASRLMEQMRQGLIALRRLRPGAGGVEEWVALSWLDERCSPAELQRRIAAAKAARAAHDSTPPKRALSERAVAARALASAEATELAAEARAGALAAAAADAQDGAGFLARLFAHELGTGHALTMRLAGRVHGALDRAAADAVEPVAALRLAGIVARLGDRFRRGLLAVSKIAAGPDGKSARRVGFVWGGPGAVGNALSAGHGVDRPDFGDCVPAL